MPNKMLYVADDDVALYERAQELSGLSLSATVVRALRDYVTRTEASQADMRELKLRVVNAGVVRHIRFVGAEVARWQRPGERGRGDETYTTYKTARGQYAVYRLAVDHDLGRAGMPGMKTEFTVVPTLAELEDTAPSELAELTREALSTPQVEDLDI